MPYPNYHSARIQEPDKYKKIRYEKNAKKFGEGIDIVWGILGPDESEIQAVRFDADKWSVAEAKAWLKKQKMKPILFEAATEASHGAVLRSDKPPSTSIMAGGSQRFLKELIHTGRFTNAATGGVYDVTDNDLADWAKTFKAMRKNGIKVPVPQTHDTTGNTDKNRGWVEDMVHEGNRLMGVLELHSDDPETLAAVSDVSIFSPPEFVDGEGRKYKRPILHVALCTDPLIPGMKGFEAVTASLSASEKTQTLNVEIFQSAKEKKMDWKPFQNAFGVKEELTDETALPVLSGALATQGKRADDSEARVAELTKQVTASRTPPEPDPEIVRLAAENRKMKLDGLVAAGRITPAVRDKLKGIFLGADNAALKASLSKGEGSAFDGFVEALKDNDPVLLGEQTRGQTMILSNSQNAPPSLDPDLAKRAEAAYPKK